MGEMKKWRNCSVKSDEGIDRISCLPGPVLAHILSFLSTKEAVHTCILSKRWKNVWASVPVLDVDFREFEDSDDDTADSEYKDTEPGLEKFLYGMLNNREPLSLDRFQFRGTVSLLSVEWLNRVTHLMPRVVSIQAGLTHSYDVLDSVFSCTSLEEIRLVLYSSCNEVIAPKSIRLMSLKVLHLGGIVLSDDFTKMLFFGCPFLEEIVILEKCTLNTSLIFSNVLKKLVIHFCDYYQQVQIICPGLVSLVIRSFSTNNITLKDITSLEYADISSGCHGPINLIFLTNLCNVTSLHLEFQYSTGKYLLENDLLNSYSFNKLKLLDIKWYNIDVIPFIVKHSPNIQKLTLYYIKPVGQLSDQIVCHKMLHGVLKNASFQCEYIPMAEIKRNKSTGVPVDLLVQILHAYVKVIGELVISV